MNCQILDSSLCFVMKIQFPQLLGNSHLGFSAHNTVELQKTPPFL